MTTGVLYLVPTPIGNLSDMTYRGVEILKSVALIAAEDTRHSKKLLNHYAIQTRCISYHKFNERRQSQMLIKRLLEGESIAVVSDAGTPAISDPSEILVKAAIHSGIRVECLPGATALIPALAASGLDTSRFIFAGFLPPKASERKQLLGALASQPYTLVFYVAPHKLRDTLIQMVECLGDRECVIAREISKIHEEYRRGKLSELFADDEQIRGEFVVLVAGRTEQEFPQATLEEMLRQDNLEQGSLTALADDYHALTGISRNRIKQIILKIRNERQEP